MRTYARSLAAVTAALVAVGLPAAASASGTPGCAGLPGTSVTVACTAPAVPATPAEDLTTVAQVNAVAAGPVDEIVDAVGQGETWYALRDGLRDIAQNTVDPLVDGVRELADNPPSATEVIRDAIYEYREPLRAIADYVQEILDGIPPFAG